MAEPEALLALKLRLIRADQPFADERRQLGSDLCVIRAERPNCSPMKNLAFDSGSFEHPALRVVELVQAGSEQGSQSRRDCHFARRLLRHRQHLRDEQRVSPSGAGDSFAYFGRDSASDELVDSSVRKWFEREAHGPMAAPFGEFRPRDAK